MGAPVSALPLSAIAGHWIEFGRRPGRQPATEGHEGRLSAEALTHPVNVNNYPNLHEGPVT